MSEKVISSRSHKWRLKRTLSRNVSFRPIEDEDVKYAWAAYKKGWLASMGGKFATVDMEAEEFKTEFPKEIFDKYSAAWSLFADAPKRGNIQVGMVLGFYSHQDPACAPFMIVGDIIWFQWASARNRVESAVNFFTNIRGEIPMVEYAAEKDKKFFEMIARHGVMRRVGTTYSIKPGEAYAMFETRTA